MSQEEWSEEEKYYREEKNWDIDKTVMYCCKKPVWQSCPHNYMCMVCGNGRGMAPDPCSGSLEQPIIVYTRVEDDV